MFRVSQLEWILKNRNGILLRLLIHLSSKWKWKNNYSRRNHIRLRKLDKIFKNKMQKKGQRWEIISSIITQPRRWLRQLLHLKLILQLQQQSLLQDSIQIITTTLRSYVQVQLNGLSCFIKAIVMLALGLFQKKSMA